MNGIKIFTSNEFGSIRTLEENGKILFCGSDIAKILGYSNARDALSKHCRGVVKRDTPTNSGTQSVPFIPESDLYRLTFGSKLPTAEKFIDWVTEDVLPTIRKTGGYVNDDDMFIETYFAALDDISKVSLKEILKNQRLMQQKIKDDAPKVLFADTVIKSSDNIPMRNMAKLLCDNNINIGEKRLYRLLRDKGILMADNTPCQVPINNGYFFIKETTFQTIMGERINKTTLVTPKGQIWLIAKVKEWLEEK